MARTTLDRQLTTAPTARARFALATRGDDAAIRRLLRDLPMPGRIALALEREPDYFADHALPGTEKQSIVATEAGAVVCTGSCTIRTRFVNGRPQRVGYLGGLRLAARSAGRFDLLRRGYEFFRELQNEQPADFYFTSIAADNLPARAFLERGLPRMPAYEFVGEFVTLVLPVPEAPAPPVATEPERCAAAELLANTSRRQFAECWAAPELGGLCALGLAPEHFHCVRERGRVTAAAALWDQRSFRQTVIRGYAPWLAAARPVVNLAARCLGTPRLPAVGSTLAHAFVAHLATSPEYPAAFLKLLGQLQASARRRGIEFLTLGFGADDPRLAAIRRHARGREYRSRIYVVRWPGLGGSARDLDGRGLGPEAAWL
jgi:hypothetical protein